MKLHLTCIFCTQFINCIAFLLKQPAANDTLDKSDADPSYPECMQPHPSDRHRPLKEVANEHPEVEGWCYWGAMGQWVYTCAAANRMHNWRYYSDRTSNGNDVLARNSPAVDIPLKGHLPLTSRDHFHTLDDTLCYVNGFYDIPLTKVDNYRELYRMSNEYCAYLEKVVPNYNQISMDDFWKEEYADSAMLGRAMAGQNWGAPVEGIWEGMLFHEAVKCLLGGVHCDMAYCARRGCMKDNYVMYDTECIGQPTWRNADYTRKFGQLENISDMMAPWDKEKIQPIYDRAKELQPMAPELRPKWYEHKFYPKWWRPDLLPEWMKK